MPDMKLFNRCYKCGRLTRKPNRKCSVCRWESAKRAGKSYRKPKSRLQEDLNWP